MFFWQNWVGIALALYLFKVAKNERYFVLVIILFYLSYITANTASFGVNAGYIVESKVKNIIDFETLLGFINVTFIPLLILSCLSISDNNSKLHKIRFIYIALTSLKAGCLTSYAASLFDTDKYFYLISIIEYFWFIPDLLVLIFGTTNPVTKRWKIL